MTEAEKKPRKELLEDCLVLDALDLGRREVLSEPGSQWLLTYMRGDEVLGRFALLVLDRSSFRLAHQVTCPDGHALKVVFTIGVDWTSCGFGGERLWFRCPGNGKVCDLRRRRLYLPFTATHFACQDCYDLTYQGLQQHRSKLWEMVLGPLKTIEAETPIFKRARSPAKKAMAFAKLQEAHIALQEFQQWAEAAMERVRMGRKLRKKDHEVLVRYLDLDLKRPPVKLEIQRAEEWRREAAEQQEVSAVGHVEGGRQAAG